MEPQRRPRIGAREKEQRERERMERAEGEQRERERREMERRERDRWRELEVRDRGSWTGTYGCCCMLRRRARNIFRLPESVAVCVCVWVR